MQLLISITLRGSTTGSRCIKSGEIVRDATEILYRVQELRDFVSRMIASNDAVCTDEKETVAIAKIGGYMLQMVQRTSWLLQAEANRLCYTHRKVPIMH